MPAGSGPGDGDRAGLYTQKLLFLWEGGGLQRQHLLVLTLWGGGKTHPTAAGRAPPASPGAAAAVGASGLKGFGWGGANRAQEERGNRGAIAERASPLRPNSVGFFIPPSPCPPPLAPTAWHLPNGSRKRGWRISLPTPPPPKSPTHPLGLSPPSPPRPFIILRRGSGSS